MVGTAQARLCPPYRWPTPMSRPRACASLRPACRRCRPEPWRRGVRPIIMPIVRILLILLAFASPAFAQDGIHELVAARDAAKAFKVYVDGVARKGGRPDLTRPDVAAMLGHIYDLDAFAALPPVEG